MDTLDYTGPALNEGSKLVVAVAGKKRHMLCGRVPEGLAFPEGYGRPRLILPGLLVVQAPSWGPNQEDVPQGAPTDPRQAVKDFCVQMNRFNANLMRQLGVAWIVLVDDSDFCAQALDNFLWVCFLRSNPSDDTYGIQSFCQSKHWGCHQSLVTDARIKSHHTPLLQPDPTVEKRAAERWSNFI
jgi:4-hydroxy-3-polyprenylbenzoate decarboxylase